VAEIIMSLITGVGTLLLAIAAFYQIWLSTRQRLFRNLDADVERVLREEAGAFLHTLRYTLLRWKRDRKIGRAMVAMERRRQARFREFREEMRELRPMLVHLRGLMVSKHPEAEDGGALIDQKSLREHYDFLARFDELTNGAEVEVRENEWKHDTIYTLPPGRRNSYSEDPTPEGRMLDIIEIRYNRLEQRETEKGIAVDKDLRKAFRKVKGRHFEIVGKFVDWKQNTAEMALWEVSVFVEALDPSAPIVDDTNSPPTEPSLAPLRMHMMHVGYLDMFSEPSKSQEIQAIYKPEITEVINTLKRLLRQALDVKRLLRQALDGIRDELESSEAPIRIISAGIVKAAEYGRRNKTPHP
jgi:hypothetical protein